MRPREQGLFDLRDPPLPVLRRRPNKGLEQGMRLHRLALELGVELAAEEPWVVRDLADLDVRIIRSLAGKLQARRLQVLFILAIEFVAVTMPLLDLPRAVRLLREAALGQPARPTSQ